MIDTIANILTILVLGASMSYSLWKASQAAWSRVRPVLQAGLTVKRVVLGLLFVVVVTILGGSILLVVQDTVELFNYTQSLSERIRSNENSIQNLKGEFSAPEDVELGELKHFSWDQNENSGKIQMISISEGLCFLTSIRGHFEGEQEWLSITRENGFWYLSGNSWQEGVKGEATCWITPAFLLL